MRTASIAAEGRGCVYNSNARGTCDLDPDVVRLAVEALALVDEPTDGDQTFAVNTTSRKATI